MVTENVDRTTWQPVLVSKESLDAFLKQNPNAKIVDRFDGLLEDLFLLRHPKYKFDKNYWNAVRPYKGDAVDVSDMRLYLYSRLFKDFSSE